MFHFDFESSEMMSFDVFLAKFEGMLIQTIIDNQSKLFEKEKSAVIQKLLDVATRFYDNNLLE